MKMKDMLMDAYNRGYAVPAFNTQGGNYDICRAIVETASEENAPVILMAYEANLAYQGYDGFAAVGKHLIEKFQVNGVIHLDHSSSLENLKSAAESGFDSLMIDYSKKSLEENIQITQKAIKLANTYGITIEAELGELQRNDQADSVEPKNLVDPDDVAHFLSRVKPDMLAIGIGNAHGFYKGKPNIRIDLLQEVHEIADQLPLVLHGTTGIPEEVVIECIKNGIAKVNFGTIIRYKYLEYFNEGSKGAVEHDNHTWKISRYAVHSLKEDIRSIFRMTGSRGKMK